MVKNVLVFMSALHVTAKSGPSFSSPSAIYHQVNTNIKVITF